MRFFEIAILKSGSPSLTYSSKDEYSVGDIVEIELRGSKKKGVVLKEVKKPNFKVKEIAGSTELFLSSMQLKIAEFISFYYFSSVGEALSLFYPYSKSLEIKEQKDINIEFNLPELTPKQNIALESIKNRDISLLFGVTGSGKTEIYIHLIADALRDKKSAILLMPEIALTPQIRGRIERYFGNLVESWHSKLSKKRRGEILNRVRAGEVKVIIGARSSLFLPLKDLDLIIVDEEHDDSYKAISKPKYNAKDLSVYIGKKFDIKVALGSATPLATSYYKFDVIRLKEPYKKARKRFIFIAGEELNQSIINAVRGVVKRGEQALIFVPTRANFKYLICGSCGKAQLCPFCSIGMSIHSKSRVLKCHYCSFAKRIPTECEFCGSDNFISKREGTVEIIERLKSEIEEAKIVQFDKDAITTVTKLSKALKKIHNKEANIIVGTQMLSKGHDYPEITLSVIMGLDFILAIGDYRAKERAISFLHQIAGRSGRSKDADVIIQTSQSDFFIPYVKDYEDFLKDELEFREIANYPPFSTLVRLLISDRDYKRGEERLNSSLEYLKSLESVEVVGSGLAPVERIANRWRFFILIRSNERVKLIKNLYPLYLNGIDIDIDPVNFG